MNRTALSLAAAAALLPLLAGCATPGACPAIGYVYGVDLETRGDFATLEVCADDGCASAPAGEVPADEVAPFFLTGGDGDWHVESLTGTFDALTVRALDETGTVLGEQNYDLEWTRTGGSDECGGPAKTPPLSFSL